jgi:hypothetical protein
MYHGLVPADLKDRSVHNRAEPPFEDLTNASLLTSLKEEILMPGVELSKFHQRLDFVVNCDPPQERTNRE